MELCFVIPKIKQLRLPLQLHFYVKRSKQNARQTLFLSTFAIGLIF